MTTKERQRQRPAAAKSSQNTATRPRRNPQPTPGGKKKQTSTASHDVVYLPPKPFQRKRLALQLAVIAAVVLAFVFGISVFFKVDVEKTTVSGCDKYSASDILAASGIQDGEYLLTFNRAQVAGRIIAKMPYVQSVRIGIKLPDTVNIDIVEVKVPYAIQASDDSLWLISAGGKVIEKLEGGAQSGYTQILGVKLDMPTSGSEAVALEDAQTELDEEGNPIPVVTTNAMRLQTALQIVTELERNGILGLASSIDVSELGSIQLWYGQQYQVKLGDDSRLDYKISCMKSTIAKMNDYESGVLDISFTTWQDKVGYTPFSTDD